jgi:hypothetical protein
MTQTSTGPCVHPIIFDALPVGMFCAGWLRPNPPKEAPVVEYPAQQIEILPPLSSYQPPARIPARAPVPQPVRDEIPEGTFHREPPTRHAAEST